MQIHIVALLVALRPQRLCGEFSNHRDAKSAEKILLKKPQFI